MKERRHFFRWFFALHIAVIVALTAVCRGGDITVTWPANSTLTVEQRQKAIAVASLWDAGLDNNGQEGIGGVIRFNIIKEPLPGVYAWTPVIHYTQNSRGVTTVDGSYAINISINSNIAWGPPPAQLPIEHFGIVLFHEMGHALGFSAEQWFMNGHIGGSPMFINGVFTFVSNNQYIGPALSAYRSYRDPSALFIPMADSHFAEPGQSDPWYNEVMTTGISQSQWPQTFLSPVTWAIAADNGWILNPNPPTGLLSAIIPRRRMPDEDTLTY